MKTAVAIRHVHFEDLGLIGDVLIEQGFRIDYRDAGIDPIDDEAARSADLVIILGGPIGAYEDAAYPFLSDELALVKARLASRRKLLGICLGAQLMARALGARVYPSGIKELGWAPLFLTEAGHGSVLAPIAGLDVLHWHGDTFDLPDGAVRLASTAKIPNQAFSLGGHALGLQFHLEAAAERIESWLIGHACEIAGVEGVDPVSLRVRTADAAPALKESAKTVFRTWLSV